MICKHGKRKDFCKECWKLQLDSNNNYIVEHYLIITRGKPKHLYFN